VLPELPVLAPLEPEEVVTPPELPELEVASLAPPSSPVEAVRPPHAPGRIAVIEVATSAESMRSALVSSRRMATLKVSQFDVQRNRVPRFPKTGSDVDDPRSIQVAPSAS
jgi:hypothetical protein